MTALSVAIWQYSAFGPGDAALEKLEELLQKHAAGSGPADLYCLPEMGLTGFRYKGLDQTAAMGPQYLDRLSALAANFDTALSLTMAWPVNYPTGPDAPKFAATYDGAVTNRHVFVTGDTVYSYDKVHLIGFGGFSEDRYFQAGSGVARPVDYKGWNIGLSVCYDLRFPELFRAMAGVDLFLLPAQWPTARHEHMKILSRARAVENQAFVAVTNCTGRHGKLDFHGESRIIGPRGNLLLELDSKEQLARLSLDKQDLTALRTEMPVLDDRRL